MAQSTEVHGGTETENMTDDEVATALTADQTAEELRRLAAHIPAVSRSRGATKAETAEEVVEQAPEAARNVAAGGDFDVSCTCGLSFSVDSAEVAEEAARQHKSQSPTHFPRAVDGRDDTGLYGC